MLLETDEQERLYFIVESKGVILKNMLRDAEQDKIHCVKEHLKALGEEVKYLAVKDYETFFNKALSKI